jgi:hypothetical protein
VDDTMGSWNAGAIGYFSRRRVVNLDGLVNDASYLGSVQVERRIVDYLTRTRVRWIVDYGCKPHPEGGPLAGWVDDRELEQRARWMTGFDVSGSKPSCGGLLVSIWSVRPPAMLAHGVEGGLRAPAPSPDG